MIDGQLAQDPEPGAEILAVPLARCYWLEPLIDAKSGFPRGTLLVQK